MSNFSKLCNDLKLISNASGSNEKMRLLKELESDELKETLKFLFDNSYPTGIAEKKFDKIQSVMPDFVGTRTFQDVINYLKKNNTGRDSDILFVKMVQSFICKDQEEEETFKKLVCKSYAMGINTPTINKVFPGLIPTFDVALCAKLQDCPNVLNGIEEYELTDKLDGMRCTAFKENDNVRLTSRQGKPWEGCLEIEQAIKDLPRDNFVFDGELTIKYFNDYPSDQVYKLTSKIVSTKNPNKTGIALNVFDVMSIEEWNTDSSKIQKDRRKELDELMSHNESDALTNLEPLYVGTDPSMISYYMKNYVEPHNYEGLVIKLTNSVYEHKRTKSWIKVKQFLEMDLIITDCEEGSGANIGKLGAFICKINHNKYGEINVKVGSGFSEYERNEFWKMKDDLKGRVISVSYFEITHNSNNEYSLRFPIFKELKEIGQLPNN